MEVLIDTSVLIDIERKHIDIDDFLSGSKIDQIFLSVITVSELWHGVYRAADKRLRNKRTQFVSGIIDQSSVISIDSGVAKTHAQIWADLALKGQLIGMNDMWIAATAANHSLALVTRNYKEFERIQDLFILPV